MTAPEPTAAVDRDMLRTYLVQHYLGASSGIRAFEAAAASWEDTPTGEMLAEATEAVTGARADLGRIIERLRFSISPAEKAVSGAAQAAGRLNPVDLLHRRSGALARIEIETLTGMLRAQRCMWDALVPVCADEPRLDLPTVTRLARLAHELEDRLADELERTARTGFSAATGSAMG